MTILNVAFWWYYLKIRTTIY